MKNDYTTTSVVEFKETSNTFTIQYDTETELRSGPPVINSFTVLSISDVKNAQETLDGLNNLFEDYKKMKFDGDRSYSILIKDIRMNVVRNKQTNTFFYFKEHKIGITSEVKYHRDSLGRLHRMDGPAIDPVNSEFNSKYPSRYFICGAPYSYKEYLDALICLGWEKKK